MMMVKMIASPVSSRKLKKMKRYNKQYRFNFLTHRCFKRLHKMDWSLEQVYKDFAHIRLTNE